MVRDWRRRDGLRRLSNTSTGRARAKRGGLHDSLTSGRDARGDARHFLWELIMVDVNGVAYRVIDQRRVTSNGNDVAASICTIKKTIRVNRSLAPADRKLAISTCV